MAISSSNSLVVSSTGEIHRFEPCPITAIPSSVAFKMGFSMGGFPATLFSDIRKWRNLRYLDRFRSWNQNGVCHAHILSQMDRYDPFDICRT